MCQTSCWWHKRARTSFAAARVCIFSFSVGTHPLSFSVGHTQPFAEVHPADICVSGSVLAERVSSWLTCAVCSPVFARPRHLFVVSRLRQSPTRGGRSAAEPLAGGRHHRAAAKGGVVAGAAQRHAGMVPQKLRHSGGRRQWRVWRHGPFSVLLN